MPVRFPCAELFSFLTSTIIHRKENEADPVAFAKKQLRFEFSHTTSTTSLHPHIEKNHLSIYLRVAKEKGWAHTLPGLKAQARSQAASNASASQVVPLVQFSEERFHQYLLNFIVADDQVCFILFFYMCYAYVSLFRIKALNVVACPEFRQLLLVLQSDLNIPHRTKMHELLLQAWRTYFHQLRHVLNVRVPHLLLIAFPIFFLKSRPLWGRSPSHWIFGQVVIADIIWPSPRIGLRKLRDLRR